MRRSALVLGALLALVPVTGGASADLEIIDIDVGAYPQVSVTVSVPAALAGEDLPAEAFTLVEDGYAVAAGVWTSEHEPLDVILVMDTSGSMGGQPLIDAKEAATGFVNRLPTGARVAIVSSGGAAKIEHQLDEELEAVLAAVGGLEAGGETALYDAAVSAAGMLLDAGPRRVMVLLSDGGDTVSTATLGDVVDAMQASGAETFVIGLQTDETDASALASMAVAGNGRMISIDDAASLGDAFSGIAADLAGRYRLVYRSLLSGPVELIVGVSYGDVAAVAGMEIYLPERVPAAIEPVATGSPTTTSAGPAEAARTTVASPSLLALPWSMPAGVAATVVGAAALMALVASSGRHTPSFLTRVARSGKRGLVSRLTHRAENVTDRVMRSRDPGRLEKDLDRAGIALRPSEFVLLSASLGIASVAGSLLVVGVPVAVGVAALAVISPRLALRILTGRRRAVFADQFDGTLQMLSGSLRAGYGLMQAVATVADEASAPTGQEFSRVAVENQLGRSVEESLGAMALRMDNDDLRWVVEAIDIQYEVGGDLAEVLDTVAETIRDRDQIRRQVKALSAEGRISAVILVTMPFAIAFLIHMVSPDYLADLTGTSMGRVMIGAALVMIGIGTAWIRRIVRVVF